MKTKWHIWWAFKQRAVLNGQVLKWTNVDAGVLQGLILGYLLPFLIYRNDVADELLSNVKLIADDTSLFSVGHNIDSSTAEVYNDLK